MNIISIHDCSVRASLVGRQISAPLSLTLAQASPKQDSSGSSSSRVTKSVRYGQDWYEATKNPSSKRTVKEEIEYRRTANFAANNGKERKDLYTDNWDGSEWKGGRFNILTFVASLFVLVPLAGLAFAYFTYGDLWG
ncbi:hypothetical protein CEUSTIGMA_g11220.t1 [Chlamydomonas eustigma]|uniref:Uncharacterized protein n=1 Tax=Chlamydomonas eustigma TaxID=1157962 RepID=A0A250XL17_9CHLO|nr:hypothetical protein CEUSTIGMA_g11220.t1 [Chlamydomonas eustigma]|eukprot:GAX83795.1 hypothetical protein CEUSTIGMA_g11220.t1 [Chlamydomonas eustigma]